MKRILHRILFLSRLLRIFPFILLYDSLYLSDQTPNMSAFLFYKPDSNPNRFSRKERFSQRLPVSSTLDGLSNGKADTPGNIPATSASSSPMGLDNDFDAELSKWPPCMLLSVSFMTGFLIFSSSLHDRYARTRYA